MNKKQSLSRWAGVLACLAFTVIFAPSVGKAMAYFTNYTLAQGSRALGGFTVTTEVTETVEENQKTVSVKNTGEVPCYVRVCAAAGEQFTVEAAPETAGSWQQEADGWWYYHTYIEPGDATGPLTFTITWEKSQVQGDFNVIVIEECTPVRYQADGTPYADWDAEAKEVGVQ